MTCVDSIDRTKFFDSVRESLFGGEMSQSQVDGMNAILTCWEAQRSADDLRWLAYVLATTYHETAQTMQPIEEYGKGSGHDYGEPDPKTGQCYYGRGFVQLTWADNYQKADEELHLPEELSCYWDASNALRPLIAALVMFKGMAQGWFTGKALPDYFDADTDDPINARRIINGNDKDTLIAGYYDQFLEAVSPA